MSELKLVSPFAVLPTLRRIEALDRSGLAIAQLLIRSGKRELLAAKLTETDGLKLPEGPAVQVSPSGNLMAISPESWLWIAEPCWPEFLDEVTAAFSDYVSVIDQSGAYGLISLRGPAVTEVLRHGPFIDFDPEVFAVGSAVVTSLAHIGVVIWRSGPEQYDIAVPRSYCGDFLHWLETHG